MEINEQTIRYVVGDVLDEKLKPIHARLDNIDTKLHNHLEHTAMNIGGINKDIAWLKDLLQKPKDNGREDVENAGQEANIEWLKWGFRLIVGTLIINIIGVAFFVIQYFINK
jgi:hypothetical protein